MYLPAGRKYYLIVPYPIAYGQETLESKIEVRTKSLQTENEDIISVNGLTKEGKCLSRWTDNPVFGNVLL
jgi:hypothetical protein